MRKTTYQKEAEKAVAAYNKQIYAERAKLVAVLVALGLDKEKVETIAANKGNNVLYEIRDAAQMVNALRA